MADPPLLHVVLMVTGFVSFCTGENVVCFPMRVLLTGAGTGLGRRVAARLATHGVDLRERLVFTETFTPGDFASRYRSPGGAIYGTSSNGMRAAFARPGNRGARDGLYLVGGSSHPGGGLPLVTTSARIVAELIAADMR